MEIFLLLLGFVALWLIFRPKAPPPSPYDRPRDEPIALRGTLPVQPTLTVTLVQPEPSYHDQQGAPDEDKDAWEDWGFEQYEFAAPERKLQGVRLHIHFVDRLGKHTQRDVDVQSYAHNPATGAGMMTGFCLLRQARRPFVFSRIQQTADPATGEIIPNIGRYLDAAYEASPLYPVELLLKTHSAALYILYCFAKADGAMRKPELTLVLDYATRKGLLEPKAQHKLRTQILKDWTPDTRHAFHQAVREAQNLDYGQPFLQELMDVSVRIIETSSVPHPEELRMLKYMAGKWGMPVPALANAVQTTVRRGKA